MYYRCTFRYRGYEFWQSSGGLYESVTDNGELDTTENGLTKQSDIPEVCCSKSPEAALLGAIQNRHSAGIYHVYETRKNPDVDISSANERDFALLEEVRFRSESIPLKFRKYDSVNISQEVVTEIQEAYGLGRSQFSKEDIETVKENLSLLLETGKYPSC